MKLKPLEEIVKPIRKYYTGSLFDKLSGQRRDLYGKQLIAGGAEPGQTDNYLNMIKGAGINQAANLGLELGLGILGGVQTGQNGFDMASNGLQTLLPALGPWGNLASMVLKGLDFAAPLLTKNLETANLGTQFTGNLVAGMNKEVNDLKDDGFFGTLFNRGKIKSAKKEVGLVNAMTDRSNQMLLGTLKTKTNANLLMGNAFQKKTFLESGMDNDFGSMLSARQGVKTPKTGFIKFSKSSKNVAVESTLKDVSDSKKDIKKVMLEIFEDQRGLKKKIASLKKAVDSKIEMKKAGGSINLIVDGSLHAHNNNLDLGDDIKITKKGMPIIFEQGGETKQVAEIEGGEIILHLTLTEQIEKAYKEKDSEEKQLEIGKLLAKEVVKNTKDKLKLLQA